jgi:predicted O-methyltransferase YrrM
MAGDRSERVDAYLAKLFVGDDPALERALAASAAAGLPPIAVSAPQGKLLYLLAQSTGARRVLEVGTLGGYSAIWFGRAVGEHGTVISLEIDPRMPRLRARISSRPVSAASPRSKLRRRCKRSTG